MSFTCNEQKDSYIRALVWFKIYLILAFFSPSNKFSGKKFFFFSNSQVKMLFYVSVKLIRKVHSAKVENFHKNLSKKKQKLKNELKNLSHSI